ncbi:hypothetical protein B9Z55_027915 [Caenorhabditis nigoni]|uniref:Uncharacterized protein n=1 Tax=Caenorhabditis nigoni TaxID=1611254 RepID=A0A2G5SEJ9_9PELO|nr:hypothetical protein B9Z55_027915 [Caenorhabditis nigoni]
MGFEIFLSLQQTQRKPQEALANPEVELKAAWQAFASNRGPPADMPEDAIVLRGRLGRPKLGLRELGVWIEKTRQGNLLQVKVNNKMRRLENQIFNILSLDQFKKDIWKCRNSETRNFNISIGENTKGYDLTNAVMKMINAEELTMKPGGEYFVKLANGHDIDADEAVLLKSTPNGFLTFDNTLFHPLDSRETTLTREVFSDQL